MFSYPSETMIIICFFVFSLGLIAFYDKTELIKFNLKEIYSFSILTVISLILIPVLLMRYNNLLKWHIISTAKIEGISSRQTIALYKDVLPELDNDPKVLIDYAKKLYSCGEYIMAIKILQKATNYSSKYVIYTRLGECYEKLENFDKAEEAFLRSCYLVPNLFYPKYRLMMLYLDHNNFNAATYYANKILSMPIKIKSKVVDEIRESAFQTMTTLTKGDKR